MALQKQSVFYSFAAGVDQSRAGTIPAGNSLSSAQNVFVTKMGELKAQPFGYVWLSALSYEGRFMAVAQLSSAILATYQGDTSLGYDGPHFSGMYILTGENRVPIENQRVASIKANHRINSNIDLSEFGGSSTGFCVCSVIGSDGDAYFVTSTGFEYQFLIAEGSTRRVQVFTKNGELVVGTDGDSMSDLDLPGELVTRLVTPNDSWVSKERFGVLTSATTFRLFALDVSAGRVVLYQTDSGTAGAGAFMDMVVYENNVYVLSLYGGTLYVIKYDVSSGVSASVFATITGSDVVNVQSAAIAAVGNSTSSDGNVLVGWINEDGASPQGKVYLYNDSGTLLDSDTLGFTSRAPTDDVTNMQIAITNRNDSGNRDYAAFYTSNEDVFWMWAGVSNTVGTSSFDQYLAAYNIATDFTWEESNYGYNVPPGGGLGHVLSCNSGRPDRMFCGMVTPHTLDFGDLLAPPPFPLFFGNGRADSRNNVHANRGQLTYAADDQSVCAVVVPTADAFNDQTKTNAEVFFVDLSPTHIGVASVGDISLVSAAIPFLLSGQRSFPLNFGGAPVIGDIENDVSGGTPPAAGTYSYKAVHFRTLPNGRRVYGPVSLAKSYTATGSNNIIIFTRGPLYDTVPLGSYGYANYGFLNTELYRTTAGGSVYYFLGYPRESIDSRSLFGAEFYDSVVDADLITQRLLYTEYETENTEPPNFGAIASYRDSAVCAELPNTLYYAKAPNSSLALSFSDINAANITEIDGAVTSISSLDQNLVVTTAREIARGNGAVPLRNGVGQPPQYAKIPATQGVAAPTLIREGKRGFLYIGNDGLYMLGRDMVTQDLTPRVSDVFDASAATTIGYLPKYETFAICGSFTDAGVIFYNERFDVFTTSSASLESLSGDPTSGVDGNSVHYDAFGAFIYNDDLYRLSKGIYLWSESGASDCVVQTPRINFGSIANFKRCTRVVVHLDVLAADDAEISATITTQNATSTLTFYGTNPGVGQKEFVIVPEDQKSPFIQLQFEWPTTTNRVYAWKGLSFELGVKSGVAKVAAADRG